MAKLKGKRILAIFGVILGLLLWTTSIASAQYPPGIGSLTASAGSTIAPVDGTTDVTCQVLGSNGQPQGGVDCTFTIVSQPGNDASFVSGQASNFQVSGNGLAFPSSQVGTLSVTKATNSNGIAAAKLNVGSTAGPIVVAVEANGIITQVTVQASTSIETLPTAGGMPLTGGEPPLNVGPALSLALLAGLGIAIWKLRRVSHWGMRP